MIMAAQHRERIRMTSLVQQGGIAERSSIRGRVKMVSIVVIIRFSHQGKPIIPAAKPSSGKPERCKW
jgi:hypothetical protein